MIDLKASLGPLCSGGRRAMIMVSYFSLSIVIGNSLFWLSNAYKKLLSDIWSADFWRTNDWLIIQM